MKKTIVGVCRGLGQVLILLSAILIFWACRDWASISLVPSYDPNQVGRMVLVGTASAIDNQQVEIAPISKTPCITYELSLLRWVSAGKRSSGYSRFLQEQKGFDNLSVQTPTGLVQIKPKRFQLTHGYLEDNQLCKQRF